MGYQANRHDHAGDIWNHPPCVSDDAENGVVLGVAEWAEAALIERLPREAERVIHPDVNGAVGVAGGIDEVHVGGKVFGNLARRELVSAGVNQSQRIRAVATLEAKRDAVGVFADFDLVFEWFEKAPLAIGRIEAHKTSDLLRQSVGSKVLAAPLLQKLDVHRPFIGGSVAVSSLGSGKLLQGDFGVEGGSLGVRQLVLAFRAAERGVGVILDDLHVERQAVVLNGS